MKVYKCDCCGGIYTEDDLQQIDVSFYVPYGEGSVLKSESESVCPYCSESFDNSTEGEICSVCGEFSENTEEINGEQICEKCFAEIQRRFVKAVEKEFTELELEALKAYGILNFDEVA